MDKCKAEAPISDGCNFKYGHPGGEKLTRRLLELLGFSVKSDNADVQRAAPSVLDFGCGAGGSMVLMRDEYGLDVSGCDADKDAINACRTRDSSLRVKRVRNNVLDYPSLSFDAVIAECSLSAITDDARGEYFHEFYCVLKKGGILAVSDIYNKSEKDKLTAVIEDADFRITHFEDVSRELASYIAELTLDGVDLPCAQYGRDTGYMILIAVKNPA